MAVHNDEVICGEFGDGAFNGRRGQQSQEVVLGIRETQHMHWKNESSGYWNPISHSWRALTYLVLDDTRRHNAENPLLLTSGPTPRHSSNDPKMLANAYASNRRHGSCPFKPVMWVSRLKP